MVSLDPNGHQSVNVRQRLVGTGTTAIGGDLSMNSIGVSKLKLNSFKKAKAKLAQKG